MENGKIKNNKIFNFCCKLYVKTAFLKAKVLGKTFLFIKNKLKLYKQTSKTDKWNNRKFKKNNKVAFSV